MNTCLSKKLLIKRDISIQKIFLCHYLTLLFGFPYARFVCSSHSFFQSGLCPPSFYFVPSVPSNFSFVWLPCTSGLFIFLFILFCLAVPTFFAICLLHTKKASLHAHWSHRVGRFSRARVFAHAYVHRRAYAQSPEMKK